MNLKIHSLTVLHYGKDYLPYALRSIYDQIDQAHIFYTSTPSHGHETSTIPPETKQELQQAAFAYDPDIKVKWYDMVGVRYEGKQRDLALSTVQNAGADLILVLDYDEVWPAGLAQEFIYLVSHSNGVRNWLVNMIHLWRSFNWACYDQGWPVRIIDLRYSNGTAYLPQERGRVYHFGYATTNRIMRYKWEIHGHKSELRPDWFVNKWSKWPPADDCHPTNDQGFWQPQMFDRLQLPEFMRDHPFYGMDRIE